MAETCHLKLFQQAGFLFKMRVRGDSIVNAREKNSQRVPVCRHRFFKSPF